MLDDGWQTAVGDWYLDRRKFPRGDADMIALVEAIKDAGIKPKLWIAPLAAHPDSDLLRDHPDLLLLDKDGATQDVTWWDSFCSVSGLSADGGAQQGARPQDHGRMGLCRASSSTASISTASRPATIRRTSTPGPKSRSRSCRISGRRSMRRRSRSIRTR